MAGDDPGLAVRGRALLTGRGAASERRSAPGYSSTMGLTTVFTLPSFRSPSGSCQVFRWWAESLPELTSLSSSRGLFALIADIVCSKLPTDGPKNDAAVNDLSSTGRCKL